MIFLLYFLFYNKCRFPYTPDCKMGNTERKEIENHEKTWNKIQENITEGELYLISLQINFYNSENSFPIRYSLNRWKGRWVWNLFGMMVGQGKWKTFTNWSGRGKTFLSYQIWYLLLIFFPKLLLGQGNAIGFYNVFLTEIFSVNRTYIVNGYHKCINIRKIISTKCLCWKIKNRKF